MDNKDITAWAKEFYARLKKIETSENSTIKVAVIMYELEKAFPELKESEDEKIRNLIYCIVRDRSHVRKLLEANGCPVEKALSWIEEQKEPKLESCDCSRDEESYTNGIHHVLMNPEAYGLIKQKPAEQLGGTCTSYDMAKTFMEGQNYVIAHPEKFGLCKPAEWKEEDEGMLNCIIATLCEESHGGRESNGKMVTWLENRLKSLRPQPHWKPSENKDVYEIAYERYPINNRLVREVTKDINEDTRDGFIDGYNYCNSTHWKPSKKQMEALEDAFRKDGGNEYRKVINSLYCDLQKLL